MPFDHEKLIIYQDAIRFVSWSETLTSQLPNRRDAVVDQLDRASTSIPLNSAEGNGRYTPRDRCRYFDIARGSALEAASCLDVLVARGRVTAEAVEPGKTILVRVVAMLMGLIRSNSDRVHDGGGEELYSVGGED